MPPYVIHRSTSIKWLDRVDNPAVIYRKVGPGFITDHGTIVFFNSIDTGDAFRAVGPAVITPDGGLQYANIKGYHRIDGPAIIRNDGAKFYAIDGVKMSELEFFFKAKIAE